MTTTDTSHRLRCRIESPRKWAATVRVADWGGACGGTGLVPSPDERARRTAPGRGHRVCRDAAAGPTGLCGCPRCGPACSARQTVAVVRTARRRIAVAAPEIGHGGRVHRSGRVPAAGEPRRRGEPSDAGLLHPPGRRPGSDVARGFRRTGLGGGSGACRGARPHLRGSRCADRAHRAQDRRHDDHGNPPARDRRGRRLPARRGRAVRLGPGGNGRGAVFAAELPARAVHGRNAAAHLDAGCRLPARRSAGRRPRPRL